FREGTAFKAVPIFLYLDILSIATREIFRPLRKIPHPPGFQNPNMDGRRSQIVALKRPSLERLGGMSFALPPATSPHTSKKGARGSEDEENNHQGRRARTGLRPDAVLGRR